MSSSPSPILPRQVALGPHKPAAIVHVSPELLNASTTDADVVLKNLDSKKEGLTSEEAAKRLLQYGPNVVAKEDRHPRIQLLIRSLLNPLVILLVLLSGFSFATGDYRAGTVMLLMVILGVALRFIQEARADQAAAQLRAMISVHASVLRDGEYKEIPLGVIVPGDIVSLTAGDMIPADLRLISAKDLFLTQGSLTGEAFPVEKVAAKEENPKTSALERTNICYLGTSVESGAGIGVVVATGLSTFLGGMSTSMTEPQEPTAFDRGMTRFTWLMIAFIGVMVPSVFLINGLTKGDWREAFFFAMAVAVGLTPEMLPMIVAVCLSKGAIAMSHKKVIIKRLNSIQNLGAMDILCTDKTGTLTMDQIILEKHCDVVLRQDDEVLQLAYLNSHFQTGLKSLLDRAILSHTEHHDHPQFPLYEKFDEIPFDFSRRLMSVVVKTPEGKHRLICKGAPEAVYSRCKSFWLDDHCVTLDHMLAFDLQEEFDLLSRDGFRVLAVAYRDLDADPNKAYSKEDESELILRGYVAFLDPPKDSAKGAIIALQDHGVSMKVLTGDNELVSRKICHEVGIATDHVLLGSQVDAMSDAELTKAAEKATLFARLSPPHKRRVINMLQKAGHVVGFMGDGINDAPALRAADVGISVDTAVDIAKESADAILLEKDLLVLDHGVIEGRKVFANILKYIRMGASSNFGNMFSVVGASIFLPFVPMAPLQILTNNLLYDFSQVPIPTDEVDADLLDKPRPWSMNAIARFILFVGPCSSIFDYTTFFVMLYVFGCWDPAKASLFQTGWFVESLLTQTLIIHVIRTNRIPFLQSRASWPLTMTTLLVIAVGIALPYSPLAPTLGFTPLPLLYWPIITVTMIAYLSLTQVVKTLLLRFKFVSS